MKDIVKLRPYQRNYIFSFFLSSIIGFFIGVILLQSAIVAIVIVCGLAFLPILRRRPEIGILAIVILLSTIIFEDALPFIPIGMGRIRFTDALLASLLFMIPLNLAIDREFHLLKTPLDTPLLLFYLLVVIQACLAIFYYKLSLFETVRVLLNFNYYLLFFVVTNLIRNERQIRILVKGLFSIGAIVGILMLAQAVIGESVKLMPGRVEQVGTFNELFQATRILPPGQAWVYVLFITSICLIVLTEKTPLRVRAWHCFLAFSTGIGVTLTYTRSYWVACILCFAVLMVFAGPVARKRLIVLSLPGFFVISVLLLLFLPFSAHKEGAGTFAAISDRFDSLFKGKELYESSSLEYRGIENSYALEQIARHPFIGIGLGKAYRPSLDEFKDTLTSYIHNGYLGLLLNVGVTGAAPLLWFYLAFILRGFRNWRRITDPYLRSLLTGFTLSVAGALLINIFGPMVLDGFSIVTLSIIMGLGEAIIKNEPTRTTQTA